MSANKRARAASPSSAQLSIKREVYVWGCSKNGRLGLGDDDDRDTPELLELPDGPHTVRSVVFGAYHSAAITEDGEVYVWGCSDNDRLGLGDECDRYTPELLELPDGPHTVRSVVFGAYHSAAITEAPDDLTTADLLSKLAQAQDEAADARSAARAVEAAHHQAVRLSLAPLPRYSRYSQMRRVALFEGADAFKLLADMFRRSVLGHRHQGRMHSPPKLEVMAIEALHCPRLQNRYLVELEDIAGITERRVRRLSGVNALPVQTIAVHELNEYLMYHGVSHDLVDRIATQGADVRYAGENAGKV